MKLIKLFKTNKKVIIDKYKTLPWVQKSGHKEIVVFMNNFISGGLRINRNRSDICVSFFLKEDSVTEYLSFINLKVYLTLSVKWIQCISHYQLNL